MFFIHLCPTLCRSLVIIQPLGRLLAKPGYCMPALESSVIQLVRTLLL